MVGDLRLRPFAPVWRRSLRTAYPRNYGRRKRSIRARGLDCESGGRAAALQSRRRAFHVSVPFWIAGKRERAESREGVAIGAEGEPSECGAHAQPAESANELADFQVRGEKIPLAEEDRPITDVAVDEGKGFGAGVFHVGTDVEKILEKPEGGEGEAVSLAVEIKVQAAEERDEKFAKGPAEDHKGAATPRKKQMAGFVDHEIREI